MGTTESIFAEAEIPIPPTRPAQQHEPPQSSTNVHRISSNTGQSTTPLSSSPSSRRRPRESSTLPDPRTTQRHRQQQIPPNTTISNSSQRPPLSTTQMATPSFQLNGMVLGMSKSGKRTLLQRLEGKDPDFLNTKTNNRKSNGDTTSNIEAPIITAVHAPYQPSSHLPKFNRNESIQLHVQASRKILDFHNDHNDNNKEDCHFYVIIVNPLQQDRMKVQKYVTKRLHDIIRSQEYDKKSGSQSPSSSSSSLYRPLCVSLLRNFCDRIQQHGGGGTTTTTTESAIQISDLTIWTMEVLQEYPHMDVDPLLQCIDVSLLNCYGLSALHHFIYQSYALQKQFSIQQELRRVQEALTMSREEAPSFVISYEEYADNIQRLLQSNAAASSSSRITSSSNSAGDETSTTAASSGGNGNSNMGHRRRIIQPHRSSPNDGVSNNNNDNNNSSAAIKSEQPRNRTMSGGSISSTLPSIPNSLEYAKDALEAFLESDSDVDEPSVKNLPKQSVHDSDSDESEEDEDYYLDETDTNDAVVTKQSSETDVVKRVINTSNASIHRNQVEDTVASDKIQSVTTKDSPNGTESEIVNEDTQRHPLGRNDKSTESDTAPSDIKRESIDVEISHTDAKNDDPIVPSKFNVSDDESDSEFFIEQVDEIENTDFCIELTNNTFDKKSNPVDIVGAITNDHAPNDNIAIVHINQMKEFNDEGSVVEKVDVSNNNGVGSTVHEVSTSSKNDQISDAVRTALEFARQDLERMMLQEQDQPQEEVEQFELSSKKSRKDKHKKKSGTTEGKKSKRHD